MDKRITLSEETVRKLKVVAAFDNKSVKKWIEDTITYEANDLYVWVRDDSKMKKK